MKNGILCGVILLVLGGVFSHRCQFTIGQDADGERGHTDSATAAMSDASRPNIVFILSDDQAWTDYGFMGHPVIKTPHLWSVQGDWKLIRRYQGLDTTQYRALHAWDRAPVRLYHLDSDPNERNDLAGEQAERVTQLTQVMDGWHRPAVVTTRAD